MKQTFLLTVISMLLFIPCLAQKKIRAVTKKPAISTVNKIEKINREKPSVYVTFENYSKYTWNKTQETYNVAWFRLHNNFNGNVSFCEYDTSVSATGKSGAHYEIEKAPNLNDPTARNNQDIPTGFTRFDFCQVRTLKPREIFLFGIIQDHLIKNTRIKIQIFYPWEDEIDFGVVKELQHYVYIYANDIPIQK